jgi:carboxyl-terminal processing protease
MTRRALIFLLALPLLGQLTPEARRIQIDTFEQVWTTIRDKHWEKKPGGLDWQAIHDEFRPKVEKAQNAEEVRTLLREMLGRLHQTHFGILPASVYHSIGEEVFGDGSSGIDLRILEGQAVVTSVDPRSPADRAGVKPGWVLTNVKGQDLSAAAGVLGRDPDLLEITLTRALLSRIAGPVGAKVPVTFLDGSGRSVRVDLEMAPPRGQPSKFGNLPEQHVWFEFARMETAGYVRFNIFLDPTRIMENFGASISSCGGCDGLIIDLRGNPGGVGIMAMGMAGYLVDKPGLRLGTMSLRDSQLNFVINPRAPRFSGPVAILMDACSASTSEIFAGGLQDLGRARVFGTRSAAAALPSVIERLPSGDAFQYAIANYVSEGGKPLEGLGVKPDVEIKLTRAALLEGRDPVIEGALQWIKQRSQ